MDDVLPNGSAVTVPLVPNGASVEVTDKNKAEYVTKLAQYRLQGAYQREVRTRRNARQIISISPQSHPMQSLTL